MKRITVELTEEQAAALLRLCERIPHSDAARYLYPHVDPATRSDQAYHMMYATAKVATELRRANVSDFPWIETGQP